MRVNPPAVQPAGKGGVGFHGGRLRERRPVSLGTRQVSDAGEEGQRRGDKENAGWCWVQVSSAHVLSQGGVQRAW